MRKTIILLFLSIGFSVQSIACSCESDWDDSFKKTLRQADFVALVKIISFDEYLDDFVLGYKEKIPYSMTAEVIKKYKGREERKRIQIIGDDGAQCRPYLSEFEINKQYLVAPSRFDNSDSTQYYFFICRTEYLEVNIEENIAYGKYSLLQSQITVDRVESDISKLETSSLHLELVVVLLLILMVFLFFRIKRVHK